MATDAGLIKDVVALITFVVGISALYFKLNGRVDQIKKDNISLSVSMAEEKRAREKHIDNLLEFFKVELKDDIDRVQQTLKEHRDNFSKLFEKVENIGISVAQLAKGLESHISNQEKICEIQHGKQNNKHS